MRGDNTPAMALGFSLAGEAMLVAEANGRIIAANDEFSRCTGWNGVDAGTLTDLWDGQWADVLAVVAGGGRWHGTLACRHADHSIVHHEAAVTGILGPAGQLSRLVAVLASPSRRRGYADSLTGLPDRTALMERLKAACAQVARKHRSAAVIFIDLDNFKPINDQLGHQAGDDLLREVARRLKACVRESDAVCRLGGDEFTVILTDLDDVQAAEAPAQHILASLAAPFDLPPGAPKVSASLGIALAPADGLDPAELLRKADIAMYQAKRAGRNGYRFFAPALMAKVLRRQEVEGELRRGLAQGEMRVHYQPIFDLANRQVVGAEALLRWHHPTRGLLLPAEFLPLAEETGLILPLGERVLERVVEDLEQWRRAGLRPVRLSVNVSRRQLVAPQAFERVLARMEETGLAPHLLELEIPESVLAENDDAPLRTLEILSAFGLGLVIEDFGTGTISLRQLQRSGVQTVKIDRLFVRNLGIQAEDTIVTEALIRLARSLNIGIVAEGVESPAQMEFLRLRGCDYAQGHLLAEALEEPAFRALLQPLSHEVAG